MTGPLLPGMALEPNGWVRIGSRRSGRVMRSYGFMRVERTLDGWRAWDVVQPSLASVVAARPSYETKILPTLAEAKAYCEACVALGGGAA